MRSQRREDADLLWAFEGKDQPWTRLPWLGEEPVVPWVDSACLPVDIPSPSPPSYASFVLILGRFVLSTYSDLPISLSAFPLPVLSPVPSLSSLAVPGQHTTDLIWAYSRVKEICGHVDSTGVRELLGLLGQLWEVDLQGALDCYGSYRWGEDSEDIVNLRDITFKQFHRRLRNFCSTKDEKSLEITWKGQAEEMRVRLETAETRTREMREEMEEKDRVIADLRKRLENKQKQTHSHSKKPISLDKYTAFTKRRPGLAVNSVLFEDLVCGKAISKVHQLSTDITNSEIRTLRPMQAYAKRKPLRKADNTLKNKASPDHISSKPSERLVFSCIRRTL